MCPKNLSGHGANVRDLLIASKKRDPYSDKYSNGKVVVIGGSESFHGAPVLASKAANNTLAALRVGAGYAITCVPKSIEIAVRKVSPELVVKALNGKNLDLNGVKVLAGIAKKADAIVIGPGTGREKGTLHAMAKFIDWACANGKRIIIDADALYSIKYVKKLNKNVLITPNGFEFQIFHKSVLDQKDLASRIKASMEAAKRLDANVLLKGHETIVTDGVRYKIIRSRSSALAISTLLSTLSGPFISTTSTLLLKSSDGGHVHFLSPWGVCNFQGLLPGCLDPPT